MCTLRKIVHKKKTSSMFTKMILSSKHLSIKAVKRKAFYIYLLFIYYSGGNDKLMFSFNGPNSILGY